MIGIVIHPAVVDDFKTEAHLRQSSPAPIRSLPDLQDAAISMRISLNLRPAKLDIALQHLEAHRACLRCRHPAARSCLSRSRPVHGSVITNKSGPLQQKLPASPVRPSLRRKMSGPPSRDLRAAAAKKEILLGQVIIQMFLSTCSQHRTQAPVNDAGVDLFTVMQLLQPFAPQTKPLYSVLIVACYVPGADALHGPGICIHASGSALPLPHSTPANSRCPGQHTDCLWRGHPVRHHRCQQHVSAQSASHACAGAVNRLKLGGANAGAYLLQACNSRSQWRLAGVPLS